MAIVTQKRTASQFKRHYRGMKKACRSKPPPIQATKKKDSLPDFNEMAIAQLQKKRKLEEFKSPKEIVEKFGGFDCNTRSRDVIPGSGSVDDYENLGLISQGAFGIVYRARNKKTGEIVAMKEELDGLSESSLTEINILKSLHPHPSIIDFKQVAVDDFNGVSVIMEFFENDLHRYMKARSKKLTSNEIKFLMKQLLEGVEFLHRSHIMHRDLKPSNILINNQGRLKICDFGLACHFRTSFGSYSSAVGTPCYRAPELLLGLDTYSCAVDMWSVGCVMAELVLKERLFGGRGSEEEEINKIFSLLGTPDELVWPGIRTFPRCPAKLVRQPTNMLEREFSISGVELLQGGFDLLNRLLTYDPAKRISAESALNHSWFMV